MNFGRGKHCHRCGHPHFQPSRCPQCGCTHFQGPPSSVLRRRQNWAESRPVEEPDPLREKCKACGEVISWGVTRDGRKIPLNLPDVRGFAAIGRHGQLFKIESAYIYTSHQLTCTGQLPDRQAYITKEFEPNEHPKNAESPQKDTAPEPEQKPLPGLK